MGTVENMDMKKLNCIQFIKKEDVKNAFCFFWQYGGCLATEMRSSKALGIYISFTSTIGRNTPRQTQSSEITIFRLPGIRFSGIDASVYVCWNLFGGSPNPDGVLGTGTHGAKRARMYIVGKTLVTEEQRCPRPWASQS